MKNNVRLIVADDHALFRDGLRAVLEKMEGVRLVAESANGRELMGLVALHHPDLVLVDISMPQLNGLEATAMIRRKYPKMRVLIISMHTDEEYVCRALKLGASGYFVKGSDSSELGKALRIVMEGDTYLPPNISRQVVEDYFLRTQGESRPVLTQTQRQVLQLIAEGHTTKEIAEIMGIGPKTADTHRMHLMKRLNVHDVAGLVRYAVQIGLIRPDSFDR